MVTGRMHSYQKNIKKRLVYLYSKKNIYTNKVTYFLKREMQDSVQN
ncbi:ORF051 [Staphylococcus phage 66]|uniref:ORF051 n=1 Tax=Staphylococcus phage 66 TaxID=320832 RepID=Q4ZE50_9CAUD|nr:ORF051 [Staphylococcus phage 66]AAX90677.1 ORF051 [Staphylococcus phage 66]